MNYTSKMKNPERIFILLLILPFFITSCDFDVPIREMSEAKMTLTRAVEVKAEKYAPDEMKAAREHQLSCHEFIKNENSDKAKEEALNAKKSAEDAITKSLPPLAADTLNEAKALRDDAVYMYSEKYAPEELSMANDAIGAAESLLAQLSYWESFLKSRDAIGYAGEAKNRALTNIPALREWLVRIKSDTDTLEANRGNEFAANEIAEIRPITSESESLLDEKKIKEAFPKISNAEEILKAAALKVLKGTAADQLALAEETLKRAGGSGYMASYKTEIDKAGGLIAMSRDEFNREAWVESKLKSQEAIDILNSIFIAAEKNIEAGASQDSGPGNQGETREYIVKLNVQNRDCLWKIADYMYRDAKLWPVIYMANRDKIKDPDLIFPGQKFIIPPIPQKGGFIKSDGTAEAGNSPDGDDSTPAAEAVKKEEEKTATAATAPSSDAAAEDESETAGPDSDTGENFIQPVEESSDSETP